MLVIALMGCGMVGYPAPTDLAYVAETEEEQAPEKQALAPQIDVVWTDDALEIELTGTDATSFTLGMFGGQLDPHFDWSGEDCLHGYGGQQDCHGFDGTTGRLRSVWQEVVESGDLERVVAGRTTLFDATFADRLTYLLSTDEGCWVWGFEPRYYLGSDEWSRCEAMEGVSTAIHEVEEAALGPRWADEDTLIVTLPDDEITGFYLGIAETIDLENGWFGEDCQHGTGTFQLCHRFDGSVGALTSIYDDIVRGEASLDTIEEGRTTLFAAEFDPRLTYMAWADDGRCWVWGQDPAYYRDAVAFAHCL